MTQCYYYIDPDEVPKKFPQGQVHVLLYGGTKVHHGTVAIGAQLRRLYMHLGVQPSNIAVDLVSIALAVTAADTFVRRKEADTSWERVIELEIPLCMPDVWSKVRRDMERTLNFLSGDVWKFVFRENGEEAPSNDIIRKRKDWIDFRGTQSVSLFSGGLDSMIWTIKTLEQEIVPVLVSHAYRGDATVQRQLASRLPKHVERVGVNAWPTSSLRSDVSMRTRSFLFIAIGILVCDAWSIFHEKKPPALVVPENGFIAVNAPLTPRRIGSHSTRTTHPHFLNGMRQLLKSVGLPYKICNPFELMTKGEMARSMKNSTMFKELAPMTVSCSKWKRKNIQCGRCFPCLVRRTALFAGNIDDTTNYLHSDLAMQITDRGKSDDLIALMIAVRRRQEDNLEQWVAQSGPLPSDPVYRDALVDVFSRGLDEVENFLRDKGLIT